MGNPFRNTIDSDQQPTGRVNPFRANAGSPENLPVRSPVDSPTVTALQDVAGDRITSNPGGGRMVATGENVPASEKGFGAVQALEQVEPEPERRLLGDEIAGAYQSKKSFGSSLQALGQAVTGFKPSEVAAGMATGGPDIPVPGFSEEQNAALQNKILTRSGRLSEDEVADDQQQMETRGDSTRKRLAPVDKFVEEKITDPIAGALVRKGQGIKSYAEKKLKEHQGNESGKTRGRDLLEVYKDDNISLKGKVGATVHRMRQQAPQMATAMLLQRFGGPRAGGIASGAGMGAVEAGGQFAEILSNTPDADLDAAALMSLGHGLASSVIEQMNVKPMFDRIPGAREGLAKTFAEEFAKQPRLVRMLKAGVEQGSIESIEEVTQNLIGNAGQRYFDENKKLTEGLFESAVIGFGPGAGTAVAIEAATPTMPGGDPQVTPENSSLERGTEKIGLLTKDQAFTRMNEGERELRQQNLPTDQLKQIRDNADLQNEYGVDSATVDSMLEERANDVSVAEDIDLILGDLEARKGEMAEMLEAMENDPDQGPIGRAATESIRQAFTELVAERAEARGEGQRPVPQTEAPPHPAEIPAGVQPRQEMVDTPEVLDQAEMQVEPEEDITGKLEMHPGAKKGQTSERVIPQEKTEKVCRMPARKRQS